MEIDEFETQAHELCSCSVATHMITLQLSEPTEIEFSQNGKFESKIMERGQFCLAPAGVIAPVKWQEPRRLLVIAINPSAVTDIAALQLARPVELRKQQAVADDQIQYLALALRDEARGGNPSGPAYIMALSRILMLRLVSVYSSEYLWPPHFRGGLPRHKLRRVLSAIDESLTKEVRITGLARLADMSADHFTRAFKQTVGISPYRYVLNCRLLRAERLLLQTAIPLSEIAAETGFADQSHLTAAFRKYRNITPGKLRAYQ